MKNRRDIKKILLLQVSAGAVLILAAIILAVFLRKQSEPAKITKALQKDVVKSLHQLKDRMEAFPVPDSGILFTYPTLLRNYFNKHPLKEGDNYLFYHSDSLLYWTGNSFAASVEYDSMLFTQKLVFQGNGFYLQEVCSHNDLRIVGLRLLKNQFEYKNDYLRNGFGPSFYAPGNAEISLKPGNYNVVDTKGSFLFSLIFQKAPPFPGPQAIILLILYLSGLLLLIAALFNGYMLLGTIFRNHGWLLLSFVADVVILRGILFYLKIPHALYQSDLFSPVYFASSSWLPSLGDLFENAFIVLQVVFITYNHLNRRINRLNTFSGNKILSIIGSFGIILLLYEGMRQLLISLILNSNFPLQFDNLFSFNEYSILGVLSAGAVMLTFLFVSDFLLRRIATIGKRPNSAAVFVLFSGLYIGYTCVQRTADWFWILILLLWVLIYLIPDFRNKTDGITFHAKFVSGIFLVAALFTQSLSVHLQNRESEHRKLMASHLSDSRDLMAEYYYKEILEASMADTRLTEMLRLRNKSKLSPGTIEEYIQTHYFKGYWNKYNVQITICSPGEKLLVKPGNFEADCETYFSDQITRNLEPVPVKELYYLKQSVDITYYLGKLAFDPIIFDLGKRVNIYIEFTSKKASRGMGYPELIRNKSLPSSENLSGYSYSYYIDNELVRSVGRFSYNLFNEFPVASETDIFQYSDGYSHLIHRIDPRTTLIVSIEKAGFIRSVSPYSFIFIMLLLLAGLFFTAYGKKWNLKELISSFRLRMQLMIVIIVLVSILLIAAVTLLYINQVNLKKNNNQLTEKLNTVLTELEFRLGVETALPSHNKVAIDEILLNLSNTNFIDLNLYTPRGLLIGSSRSQIFDEKLVSRLMDPDALFYVSRGHRSIYLHYEKIGQYPFVSAYAPVRNFNNKLLGYLNLPYFAQQEEIRKEVSSLVATFANIYIFIATLSVFLALLLSKYITKPLQIIRSQMGNLQLGSTTAKVDWQRRDEIGSLVSEYNRMVDELARSAELLAKSEREGAWRQMARQVAHEIKNPLTPIKLSMQLLLKAWEDKSPDWEIRLKRFSQTLIMQIDTLSAIATEFSDFAQMPEPSISRFDLVPVIQHAVGLFKDAPGISIRFDVPGQECLVKADEKQMLRVFNNLIKNAIQAIPADKEGSLAVAVQKEESEWLITFTDNGSGIPAGQQTRIFSPNFTTKTAGMGLGLAMVKNIIDSAGGRIWFESIQGEGTTFFINLPCATD